MSPRDHTGTEASAVIIRAAVAEAGGDPSLIVCRNGRLYARRGLTRDMAWRAWAISRQARGKPPRCWACFDASQWIEDWLQVLRGCEATHVFELDCGVNR